MPSILRLPCVVSNGICNRATGDRQNRATATGPPGAGLRDRTPTTPNAARSPREQDSAGLEPQVGCPEAW